MTQLVQAITLTGSIATVTEYFGFAANAILYQRGVYPADQFQLVQKYNLPLYVSNNKELSEYMGRLLQQVMTWLQSGDCKRLVLLLLAARTEEVVERWEFMVDPSDAQNNNSTSYIRNKNFSSQAAEVMFNYPPSTSGGSRKKDEEQVKKEIQAVMRQITASVSFLPTLEGPLAFDVLVYTTPGTAAPADNQWEPSDPRLFERGTAFHLKPFDTSHHKVNTVISYRETM